VIEVVLLDAGPLGLVTSGGWGVKMHGDDCSDLPLFHGPHIRQIRFERALECLDLRTAAEAAPEEWKAAVEEMAVVLEHAGSPVRAKVEDLVRCRREAWPRAVERVWQRLIGLNLDGRGIPGTYGGEVAAAFLLRAGETKRAHRSLRRHLHHHPRDVRGWELLASFEPVRAAARCGFHGGPLLDTAGELIDLVCEDGLQPVEHWLLSYAWLTRQLRLDEIRDALDAEHMLAVAPFAVPGDARAFAWYLLDAGGQRYVGPSVGVIEARQRLQRISEVAFRRYLGRV
jgi:hypothetical protein